MAQFQMEGSGLVGEIKGRHMTEESLGAAVELIRRIMVQYKIDRLSMSWEGPWSWAPSELEGGWSNEGDSVGRGENP